MERRIALGISVILVGTAFAWVLVGVGTAQTSTTNYTFEDCEQGWTVTSNAENPLTPSTWEHGAPGDESEMAWHIQGGPGGGEEESLTSPAHTVTGSAVTITYRIAHDTTTEQVFVEWSSDGEAWEELEGKMYQGTNEGNPAYISDSATFTPPSGEVQIRFRWLSDLDPTPGGATADVDNVTINRPAPADAACETASPSPSGSASASPSPTDQPEDPRGCTIVGTEDDDTLTGTSRNDVICGYEGDDTMNGRGGSDKIYGDQGGDEALGGLGNDRLKGGGGKDDLGGGRGNDQHNGGGGTDTCNDDQGTNRFRSCEK